MNLGYNPYDHGFTVFSTTGVELAYLYFQIPLMILVISPAIDGLRARVARGVGEPRREPVPVLAVRRRAGADAVAPRRDGAALRQLVLRLRDRLRADWGSVNLIPITIGFFLSGNVLDDPHLGQAIAFGMFVVLALMMLIYIPLHRVSSRWVR